VPAVQQTEGQARRADQEGADGGHEPRGSHLPILRVITYLKVKSFCGFEHSSIFGVKLLKYMSVS
jgi:hypothetical protein